MHRPRRIFSVLVFIACLLAYGPADGADNAAPTPPADVKAQSGGNSEIALTWTASPGATGYEIYRSTTQNDSSARRVATNVSDTSHLSTGLKNDSTYYFRIKAVSPAGASAFSAEVAATTLVTGQPLPDGLYTITPKRAPTTRLQAGLDGRVEVRPANRAPEQLWRLTSLDGAIYRLSPASAAGQSLSVENGRVLSLASEAAPSATQRWRLTFGPAGHRLVSLTEGSPALQLQGDTADVQPADDAAGSQVWHLLPPAEGAEGAPDPGRAYVPSGYQLVFSDEFDGKALDTEKWEPLAPFSQPHLNEEMENYLPEAVTLENGFCVLTAEPHNSTCFLAGKDPAPHCRGKHSWRSGSITSRSTRTHGYYEARIKVPQGQGLWPAFWLTSSKRWPPEWDIVEIPFATGILYQYMHPTQRARLTWVGGGAGSDSTYTVSEGMPNPYDGFVIYGCEVTPEDIKMWVNGRLTVHWQVSTDMTDPMWVALNLAVGGKWPGPPDATTPRPARMFIDYLRVYQRPPDPHLAQPAVENPVPGAGP